MAVSTERDPVATRAALAAWLQRRTGAARVEVGDLTIPGLSGFSNETLLFDAAWDGDVHRLVIRVEPTGHTVFPSTAFDAQVRVMQALAAEGSVPVPEVHWFEEGTDVLGARFVCMGRVEGEVPADNPGYHGEGWMPALDEAGQRRVWESGIDTMAAIHRLDRVALGLHWIPEVAPAAQLQLDHEYRTFACGAVPYPVVDRAFELLEGRIPTPSPRPALCWGDSRIGNMIFGPDQRVAAVLDWEMVTAGDPVQDLAWYLLLDRHHTMAFDVPRLPGLPPRAESVARWEAASGRSAEHLDWYELLAAARYASIMVRVMKLLDSTGVLPGAAEGAFDQTGTRLLAELLDEPRLTAPTDAQETQMLSPLDDLPIHQVAQPIRQPGTSDRNFYDRYYFNCHPCSDDLFLIIGQGQYPNLGVQDAFALVRRGDEHRVVRASRELGLDRLDLSVGPFAIEVIEGLKTLRCTLDAPEHGLSYDLTWEGFVPAFQEPPHVDRNANGRAFLDACRLAQLGSWSGWLEVDGDRIDVTPDHWWGSRDRSWGIRPVGEAEDPGILATKPAGAFRWLYAPFRMPDHAMVFICQEREDGSRVLEEAVRLWPDGRVDFLGRPDHDLQWSAGGPGLFGLVDKATLRFGDLVVEVEPVLPVHIGVGTGYGFDGDGWKHGAYQGDLVIQGKVYDLATEEGRGAMFGIVDSVARFRIDGVEGWGLLEHLYI